MIIRSQDRTKLIIDDMIYEVGLHTKKIWCASLKGDSAEQLAVYSTQEKALKVLDMLEQYCRDYNKYNYYRYDDSSSSYNLNSKVFKFPEDNEVEFMKKYKENKKENEDEKIQLTNDEKAALRLLAPKYKYIARDADTNLYVYYNKPTKAKVGWTDHIMYGTYNEMCAFNHCFKDIQWTDDEPTLIADLLK